MFQTGPVRLFVPYKRRKRESVSSESSPHISVGPAVVRKKSVSSSLVKATPGSSPSKDNSFEMTPDSSPKRDLREGKNAQI